MQVSEWGTSLAVRLPAAVVEALALKEGDEVELKIAGQRVFQVARVPDTSTFLARLRKYRGRLPTGFKFDRLEANMMAASALGRQRNPKAGGAGYPDPEIPLSIQLAMA